MPYARAAGGFVRFWLQFDDTFVVLDVENVVGRLGGFTFGIDAEGARFGWRATDRQVDECFGMFRHAFDDGDVGFFGGALGKLFLEKFSSGWRACADENARGFAVEAVNDARAIGVAGKCC